MDKAIIFTIQRASFVDGPGIRTCVFFKGCNLQCVWCHNPESQKLQPQMMVYKNRCADCGLCKAVCPHGAVLNNFFVDKNKCLLCGVCVDECPQNAREICGQAMSVEEVFAEIIADKDYYGQDGGVTFSGGECMLHLSFLMKLLIRCWKEGICTAIDTAGHVPFEYLEQVEPWVNWFLYDIKTFTPQLHQQMTGVANDRILANYKMLQIRCPEKLLVRVPVIPNCNEQEMMLIARFLGTCPPAAVELLPYHAMGVSKAMAMGLEPFRAQVPSPERMESLRTLFSEKGLKVL